jgi:predicted transcriptional regulator of viral defense system
MDMEIFLAENQVFTYRDLDDHLSRRPPEAYWSRAALLARLKRGQRVVRIRRGLFAAVPEGEAADSFEVDPLLVAAKLTVDAVITHGSALEYLGLIKMPAGEAFYSAGRPLNPIAFRGKLYRGVKFPKSLVRDGLQQMMVKTVDRGGVPRKVATAERSLVDLIDRPDLAGGWAAAVKLLSRLNKLDLSAVVAYTRALANSTTAAKVGWYLTGRREAFGDSERHLEELSALKPNQPHYLDRSRRRDGRLVADWNLIVNCEE